MLHARVSARPALDDLIALAREAGAEIMRVRGSGFATSTKQDGSPVTLADQGAEAIIETGLRRLSPGIPMLGEEAVASGRVCATAAQFFCVDPLDGTRDFIAGGDQFTVNIALIEDSASVMGVVFAPVSGELFAGEPGRALKGGAPIKTQAPGQTWRVIASERSGRDARTAAFAAALGPHALTHASSSIKFCRIAEGAADLYPRFGQMNEWDAAAGHAVLAAAGGGVMRLDGAPLRYGAHANGFLIRGLVAYGSDAARTAALGALKRSNG